MHASIAEGPGIAVKGRDTRLHHTHAVPKVPNAHRSHSSHVHALLPLDTKAWQTPTSIRRSRNRIKVTTVHTLLPLDTKAWQTPASITGYHATG